LTTQPEGNSVLLQKVDDDTYLNRPSGAPTVTYTVNALNQYTAVGAVTPTYDANGNLTFDGSFTYGYDAENRLVSASGAGTAASYGYDGLGRRKTKTVNGTTTVFVSSFDERSGGDQEVLDYDGASGQVLRRHVYGSGIDQPLNRIDVSGARVALISDVQGSIVASLDAATGTVTKTPYQTFGESADASGSYRYTGRRIDAETNGLYYYRARMYSPALGRFLQPDPIGYAGGANLYAYVGNDPLNRTDPSGEFINFVIGGAIGFGIDLAAQYAEARIAGRDFHIDVTRSLIATGVGVATSGASAFVSSGAEIGASAVAQAVGSSFARRVVSNAVIGAAGNVGQTAALNNLDGKNGSYAESAALGAVFGAAGSVAGDLISGVGSVAGAVPGRGVSVGQANLINNIANTSGALLTTVSPAAVTAGTAFGAAVGNLSGFSDAGHEAAGSHGK
jgi:RHS repeat-associated protein